jgi:hypothetical protein
MMRIAIRFLLAVSFVATIPAAAATSPITLTGAPGDRVELEFLRASTAYADALVVANAGTKLDRCPYLTAGGEIASCFFDTASCSDPPNVVPVDAPEGPCEQPSGGEFTCECWAHYSATVGTIEDLAGKRGATKAAVDFRLLVDKTRGPDWTVDETLDSSAGQLRATQLGANEWLLEWEDRPGNGDEDFNDFVAVLRSVPGR